MTQIKSEDDICQYNIVLLLLSAMRHFILICLLLMFSQSSQAQENQFVDEPKYVLKFAPRIFSPRITYEKILDNKNTVGVDTRLHLLWIPQAIRFEGFYRRYLNRDAPFGAYVQPKIAIGYFDYRISGYETNGLQAGLGIAFGGQYSIGRKKAVVDVFGGLQMVAPVYFSIDYSGSGAWGIYNYNLLHYTLIAFPLEFGVRFGFVGTKKVAIAYPINPSIEY